MRHPFLPCWQSGLRWVAILTLSCGLSKRVAADPNPLGTFSEDSIPNAIWSQWVWPLFIEVDDHVFGGAVKSGIPAEGDYPKKLGGVWALQALHQGNFTAFESAPLLSVKPKDWTVDDHNAPCVVPDLRETATAPLLYFQADHNGDVIRQMRAPNRSINRLSPAKALDLSEGGKCYGMAARNPEAPDTVWLWYRRGGAGGGIWHLASSTDNGVTWQDRHLFGKTGEAIYMLAKETAAGDGWHLVFHQHPIMGPDQRIAYLRMSWDGVVSAPGLGTVIADGLAEVDRNYNPFDEGASLILRRPDEGHATRLFDFMETESGFLELVWAEFIHREGEAYEGTKSEYRHARFDLSTGATQSDTSLGEAGWPQEVPAGKNDYFCGLTVAGPYEIVKAVWNPKDDLHANHLQNRGHSELVRMRSSDSGDSWESKVLATAKNQKFMRPITATRYRLDSKGRQRLSLGRHLFVSLGTYENFNTWDASLKCFPLR